MDAETAGTMSVAAAVVVLLNETLVRLKIEPLSPPASLAVGTLLHAIGLGAQYLFKSGG